MLKKFSKGHWPIFLLSSFSAFGNLFLPIILVRLLNPDEVGYYKIFFLHLTAIPFLFMTGGPLHSVFFWAGKDEEEKTRSLNATWTLTLLLSALVLIVALPFYRQISGYLGMPALYVALMLIAGALWCPSGHFSEATIALGRTGYGSLFDTFFEMIKTIGFIFLAWKFRDIKYLFIFYPSLLLLKLFINAWFNSRRNAINLEFDPASLKKVLKYCFPISFAGCLGFFVDKLDLLILSAKLEATNFAFYSMGCLVIPPLYLLEMSVQKVLIPELSKDGSSAHFRKAVNDISFLIIPSIFGLITFAGPIVTLLYTESYLSSAIYLKLFALSYMLLIFPHDPAARATGNTGWILKMYMIITPISLIACYLSAGLWGARGVLIASLLIKFIPKVCGLYYSRKIMNWSWAEMFPHRRLVFYSLTATILSLVSVLLRPVFNSDMTWFLVCSPAFAIIYLTTTQFSGRKVIYAKPAL